MQISLDEAIRIIKTTMHNQTTNNSDKSYPYFFVVGAGISSPEIPTSNGIIKRCKEHIKNADSAYYDNCLKEIGAFENNPMQCYSAWINRAYPNRIDRSRFFKGLIAKAKISSANLMIAQILNSNDFINTVFTTNFDDSIKKALELMGTSDYFIAENEMDNLAVNNQTKEIQIIHVHGTYKFYDCANLSNEIDDRAARAGVMSASRVLSTFLYNQAPIVVGYSGWENDVVMSCIKERIQFATPLQYIWVCHSRYSYSSLPDWLKSNDNVCFVVPADETEECVSESSERDFIEKKSCIKRIEASLFFKRIVSEFSISQPLIFSDPYLHFSKRIDSLLPADEDVLHLRNWANRMKAAANSGSKFDSLVQQLEKCYSIKDYAEATLLLSKMNELSLNESDIEFVCSSLIRDFIKDEDAVADFDQKYAFHVCAAEFVDKVKNKLSNKTNLNRTLRKILFIEHNYSESQKHICLVEQIIQIANKDADLLDAELTAIGVLSSYKKGKERIALLNDIVSRCPKDSSNTQFSYLLYMSNLKLSMEVDSIEAPLRIQDAEAMLPVLNDDELSALICCYKAKLLSKVDTTYFQTWLNDILDTLGEFNDKMNIKVYCKLIYNISKHDSSELAKHIELSRLEDLCINILNKCAVDQEDCEYMYHCAKSCNFMCRITNDSSTILYCCQKVFELQEVFPHMCMVFGSELFQSLVYYLGLPDEEVSKQEKRNIILKIKQNPNANKAYYDLLYYGVITDPIISDEIIDDVNALKKCKDEFKEAYRLYRKGDYEKAEIFFSGLADCMFTAIADAAKTNLLFMIRRNETKKERSFKTVFDSVEHKSVMVWMNVLLYCVSLDLKDGTMYENARKRLLFCTDEEIGEIMDCWSDVDLVGEAESKAALSLIESVRLTTV